MIEHKRTVGICSCGKLVTIEMVDVAYIVDSKGLLRLAHVDCAYEDSLQEQFEI